MSAWRASRDAGPCAVSISGAIDAVNADAGAVIAAECVTIGDAGNATGEVVSDGIASGKHRDEGHSHKPYCRALKSHGTISYRPVGGTTITNLLLIERSRS